MGLYEILVTLCIATSSGLQCFQAPLPTQVPESKKLECEIIANDLDKRLSTGGEFFLGEAKCQQVPVTS